MEYAALVALAEYLGIAGAAALTVQGLLHALGANGVMWWEMGNTAIFKSSDHTIHKNYSLEQPTEAVANATEEGLMDNRLWNRTTVGFETDESGENIIGAGTMGTMGTEAFAQAIAATKGYILSLQQLTQVTQRAKELADELTIKWRDYIVFFSSWEFTSLTLWGQGQIVRNLFPELYYKLYAQAIDDIYDGGYEYKSEAARALQIYTKPVHIYTAQAGQELGIKAVIGGIEMASTLTASVPVSFWNGFNESSHNGFIYVYATQNFTVNCSQFDPYTGVTNVWQDTATEIDGIYMYALSMMMQSDGTMENHNYFCVEPQVKNDSYELTFQDIADIAKGAAEISTTALGINDGWVAWPRPTEKKYVWGGSGTAGVPYIPLPVPETGLGEQIPGYGQLNPGSETGTRKRETPVAPADDYVGTVIGPDADIKELDRTAPITDAKAEEAVGEAATTGDPDRPVIPIVPFGPTNPSLPSPTINIPAGSGIVPTGGPGVVHVYNVTPSQFTNFCSWLWVQYSESTMQKIWNNPFDGVIGAYELFITPEIYSTEGIRCGFLTGPSGGLVTKRFYTIDCGTIVMAEKYHNYLDYSPYTKVDCYLPFVGIVELNADDIIGTGVNIKYNIDAYNGVCVAIITVAKDGSDVVLYQFNGNCSTELPMSGGSQASIKAGNMMADATQRAYSLQANAQQVAGNMGVVSGIGTALTGLAALNPFAAVGGAMNALSSYATTGPNVAATKAQGDAMATAQRLSGKSVASHSGNFGGSAGALSAKIPYLIVRRPKYLPAESYAELYGYPAYKTAILEQCPGYVQVRECHVNSTTATEAERQLIYDLLKAGVYI